MIGRWVVSDDWAVEDGKVTVIGDFGSEQDAAEFISTLPDHLEGRYNLDPPDSEDSY